MEERHRKVHETTGDVLEVGERNERTSGKLDLKARIEESIREKKRRRQQARDALETSSEEAPVDAPDDGHIHDVDGTSANEVDYSMGGNTLEHGGQHERSMADKGQTVSTATTRPSMTPQESAWWAMSFDELYGYAKSKQFGQGGKDGRKSGRIRMIKFLCEREGITPYVAPIVEPEATSAIARPKLLPTGAISHPEAILRTSDPALQALIDEAERKYKTWPAADLLELAMQRSYQLLKDSKGKLPSKSIPAMANWLAAWDVLKSPREKKWWLSDGLELLNKAKAMGFQAAKNGSSKKYDVILWLRSTPEDSEIDGAQIAEPTPNKVLVKRKADEFIHQHASKRPAKGSKRPHGWHVS